jgi:hypothetical protein
VAAAVDLAVSAVDLSAEAEQVEAGKTPFLFDKRQKIQDLGIKKKRSIERFFSFCLTLT